MNISYVGVFLVLVVFYHCVYISTGESIKDRLGKPLIKVNEDLDALKGSIESLQTQATEAEQRIDALDVSDPIIYFSATPKNKHSPGVNARVIFDDVSVNQGNGFDPSSSIFTAPVSGHYIFTVQLGTRGSGNTDFALVNQGVIMSSFTGNDGYYSSGMTTITHVTRGHQVYVIKTYSDQTKDVRPSHKSPFSGFLLRADP